MTFYKHFPSKARLVAEYLRHKNVVWLDMLERVLAIFDALDGSFRTPPFRGCPFVKGLAEFGPDANSPDVQATIAAYFQGLHDLAAALIAPLALRKPEKAVLQILSLIQGSIVMAQTTTDSTIAAANRDAARLLLESAPAR